MRSTSPARLAAQREPLGLRHGWGVLLGAWLGAAAGIACTLELPKTISCGDGWVDEEFEECDPAVLDSFVDACVGTIRPRGTAACDPDTCTIINTWEQCAVCGDGIVDDDLEGDRNEECDGDNLDGLVCPGGVGTLQCASCRLDTTYCQRCGNTIVDPGEECDPNMDPSGLTQGKPDCEELPPYYADKPYTSGQPGSCRADCRWDRSTCGYCNNGQLEDEHVLVDDGIPATPEQCDGNEFDPAALDATLANSVCTTVDANLWPTTRTCEGCFEITFVEDRGEPCCVRPGGPCPEEGGPVRCCSEIDGHDETDETNEPPPPRCQYVFTSGVWFNACK
jgi:hypothetical protein